MISEIGVFILSGTVDSSSENSIPRAENIMKAGIKGESKVRAFNMTVEKLSKPPFILVPKINPMEKSN